MPADGSVVWDRNYQGASFPVTQGGGLYPNESALDLCIGDADGNVYVHGLLPTAQPPSLQEVSAKYSAAGDSQFIKRLPLNYGEVNLRAILLPANNRITYFVENADASLGYPYEAIDLTNPTVVAPLQPAFFDGESSLGGGIYYLQFASGNPFGYHSHLVDPHYIYHFDLGYEYVFDASDGNAGVYLYDFASNDFFYTSPGFSFPYLYDFGLNSTVYYYPEPNNAGHYNTDGVRYFYVSNTGDIISK